MPDGQERETRLYPWGRWPWQQPTQAAPALPAQPTRAAIQRLAEVGIEREAFPGFPYPPPTPAEQIAEARRAEREAAAVDLAPEEGGPTGYSTHALAKAALPNENWEVVRNEFGRFDINRKPTAPPMSQYEREILSARERERLGFAQPGGVAGQAPTDAFGRTATWSARLGEWDYPPNWGQRPVGEPEPISPFEERRFGLEEQQLEQQRRQQQAQFGLQEQQFGAQQAQFAQQLEFQQAQAQAAQAEQEQRYRAQLAAQPINWLQYAAYTGEQPVVQPWMIPLGFQETGGQVAPQGMQIGQPLPGVQGQQTFAGLPPLTTPSAQLQAQWGPTAQQQFLGYRQARTGAAPEETQFRLGAGRAPTGAFGGFSRFR